MTEQTQAAARATGPDPMVGPSNDQGTVWHVPWHGGVGELTVQRSVLRGQVSVAVDGSVVAQMPKPTLQTPWVESGVSGASPTISVVQMQPARYWYKTRVFVDGVSIDDGFTLDDWLEHKPAGMDTFEQGFRGFLWGPAGVVIVGGACALPLLSQFARTSDPSWLVGALAGFVVGGGWVSIVLLLVRWLRTKHSWSWRVRRLIVGFALLGVPLLVVLTAQALLPSR